MCQAVRPLEELDLAAHHISAAITQCGNTFAFSTLMEDATGQVGDGAGGWGGGVERGAE